VVRRGHVGDQAAEANTLVRHRGYRPGGRGCEHDWRRDFNHHRLKSMAHDGYPVSHTGFWIRV
jgi:hypothetical protein